MRHEAKSPSASLARRAQLRETLEHVLEASRLGTFAGGSSGEFHYEYTFRVRDATRATTVLREALLLAGVAASQFDIDDLGPEE